MLIEGLAASDPVTSIANFDSAYLQQTIPTLFTLPNTFYNHKV